MLKCNSSKMFLNSLDAEIVKQMEFIQNEQSKNLLNAVIKFINHPKLCHLPFYLETPNELDGYAAEIKLLRENFNDIK